MHTDPKIHIYEEQAQDLPRVLNIFIRLNQGGTVLSYSDLLLSTAVAQWKKLDARSEIHRLVDELNRMGTGFGFTHDFVLKAGLMLADIASVGFKVENFTPVNMTRLESQWDSIRTALLRSVELVASFGFNGQWGDLDTHGFAILHRARSYLPTLKSVLMDEDTLLSHKALWVDEKEQHPAAEWALLTAAEQVVYQGLKQQRWGQNVRLEQERIAWDIAWNTLRGSIL